MEELQSLFGELRRVGKPENARWFSEQALQSKITLPFTQLDLLELTSLPLQAPARLSTMRMNATRLARTGTAGQILKFPISKGMRYIRCSLHACDCKPSSL